METILYQNKFCQVIAKDTFYILRSKSAKYNDQYYTTLDQVKKQIGEFKIKF